jgi:Tol biopolymer transport system component
VTVGPAPFSTETVEGKGISDNGRYIAFASPSGAFAAGDTDGKPDIFVRDMTAAVNVRVSLAATGADFANPVYAPRPALSADGRAVIFDTLAPAVVADTNNRFDVFVRAPLHP